MSKINYLTEAVYNTVKILSQPKYRNYRDVVKTCEKLLCQAHIFELIDLGEDTDSIAAGTNQSEKTIRFQRDGDQASLNSVALYKRYIGRVRAKQR
jgi:hypothetical protein